MFHSNLSIGELVQDLVAAKRALVSVSDKSGLAEFATALVREFGVQLISTGGTAKFLRAAGLEVMDVSDVTNFPEMMDGRVKTLHPKIHGGLLALRDDPDHAASMREHDIGAIDLVCVNLYPFEQTIARGDVTLEEAIENIDIGGPSMVRSGAKNHAYVAVVTDPRQYEKVLGDLRKHGGSTCAKHRAKLAQAAFAKTAQYDATIAGYLAETLEVESAQAEADAYQASVDAFKQNLSELVVKQAVAVTGTEAFAFRVSKTADGFSTEMLTHIRPDASDVAAREEAVKAAREMLDACLRQDKDGVIDVSSPDERSPRQYCLLTLLRYADDVLAATVVIARAATELEAQRHLGTLRGVAHDHQYVRFPHDPAAAEEEHEDHEHYSQLDAESLGEPSVLIGMTLKQTLRYGENPHQKAALYVDDFAADEPPTEASVAHARQLHGKELSYINLLDADAALSVVKEFAGPAACVVKHATPCCTATAGELATAFANAYAGDPIAAFGGIVALNRAVDIATARGIVEGQKFLELIVAPSFDNDALELLKARWKNTRLLALDVPIVNQAHPGPGWVSDRTDVAIHKIIGGYLVQERDLTGLNETDWKVVSKRQPTEAEMNDLRIAWLVCKHVKSNAIVIARDQAAVGIGGGQVDRVNAARIAVMKAGEGAKGAVAASDAFFPFPDGPELLLNAGVTAIIHPGGSLRDNETIALADARGAAVVLTGQRHFRH